MSGFPYVEERFVVSIGIYPSVDTRVVITFVNNAAENTRVQISACTLAFRGFGA